MKNIHTFLTISILFMILTVTKSLLPHHYIPSTFNEKVTYAKDDSDKYHENGAKVELGMELYPTGSSLPDCSHACGPCFPCKRVMISFKCSTESCPIVYRCMCRGKYYHVPSN
ncbi:EPIDERMAL PATTERNING FACTOR-like protein 6 [Rhododendron vialii]|uniref:EPIDERMAL PATTERNING FACTOR-like protein 6 n=1 Tax=Rhododendron vialii TaxID=182163 RepID=UPI00265EAE7C|nr:EPIDERMAL PATTERNING FACTOR-like protein 6 [Rhododendron vialii]